MIHGWLNLYKPAGLSSAHAVAKVRRALGVKRIGHGGTLDPLAEGVLPLAMGEATKTMAYVQHKTKVYEFNVAWGAQTTTDDREGDACATSDVRPAEDQIRHVLSQFIGEIQQVPPIFSALKVNGKRAYELARQNQSVEMKPRPVHIDSLVLIECVSANEAIFQVTCGKGTYVRSLARDIAVALGTVGHVTRLVRKRVGLFCDQRAIFLEKIQELGHNVFNEGYVIPFADVLDDIPAICVDQTQQDDLLHGRQIKLTPDQHQDTHSGVVFCENKNRMPLALGILSDGLVQPNRVFNIEI